MPKELYERLKSLLPQVQQKSPVTALLIQAILIQAQEIAQLKQALSETTIAGPAV